MAFNSPYLSVLGLGMICDGLMVSADPKNRIRCVGCVKCSRDPSVSFEVHILLFRKCPLFSSYSIIKIWNEKFPCSFRLPLILLLESSVYCAKTWTNDTQEKAASLAQKKLTRHSRQWPLSHCTEQPRDYPECGVSGELSRGCADSGPRSGMLLPNACFCWVLPCPTQTPSKMWVTSGLFWVPRNSQVSTRPNCLIISQKWKLFFLRHKNDLCLVAKLSQIFLSTSDSETSLFAVEIESRYLYCPWFFTPFSSQSYCSKCQIKGWGSIWIVLHSVGS